MIDHRDDRDRGVGRGKNLLLDSQIVRDVPADAGGDERTRRRDTLSLANLTTNQAKIKPQHNVMF
jgi:hypothetical protein